LELQRKIHQEILPDSEPPSTTITKTTTTTTTAIQLTGQMNKQAPADLTASDNNSDNKMLRVKLEEKLVNFSKTTTDSKTATSVVNYDILDKNQLQASAHFQTKITSHVQQEINSEHMEIFSKDRRASMQLCYKQNSNIDDSLYDEMSSSSSSGGSASCSGSSGEEEGCAKGLSKGTSMNGLDLTGGGEDGRESRVRLDEDVIDTRLFEAGSNRVVYSYVNAPWRLFLKKEVFSPGEKMDEALVVDLVVRQVMRDYAAAGSGSMRITERDKGQLTNLLEMNGFMGPVAEVELESFGEGLKRKVVELAREWPFYFSRLFPVAVSKQRHGF